MSTRLSRGRLLASAVTTLFEAICRPGDPCGIRGVKPITDFIVAVREIFPNSAALRQDASWIPETEQELLARRIEALLDEHPDSVQDNTTLAETLTFLRTPM